MTDQRRQWGGTVGTPAPKRTPSKHRKYGQTYLKTARVPSVIRRDRLRVAADILNSLGKGNR